MTVYEAKIKLLNRINELAYSMIYNRTYYCAKSNRENIQEYNTLRDDFIELMPSSDAKLLFDELDADTTNADIFRRSYHMSSLIWWSLDIHRTKIESLIEKYKQDDQAKNTFSALTVRQEAKRTIEPDGGNKRFEYVPAKLVSGCTRSRFIGCTTLPGGDCLHFIGFPGKSIPGQHDGRDDTVDEYGKPNGWCWSCWKTHQIEQLNSLLLNYEDIDWRHDAEKALQHLSGNLNYDNVGLAKQILKNLLR